MLWKSHFPSATTKKPTIVPDENQALYVHSANKLLKTKR